jgi:Ala-tRNA(Pro) deacylase
MAMLERLLEFLDVSHVEYLHTVHEPAVRARDVACAEHMLTCNFAKSVIFHTETGFAMAVLPSDRMLDLKQLRQALGIHHVRLATEEELQTLFPDSELGAMPPIGSFCDLPVYADGGMAADTMIAFNAGTHRDVVHLRFQDYLAIVKPAFIPLVKPLAESA